MLIEAISLRGYCRTFRPPRPASLGKRIGNTAFDPAMRITKLTTIASTGRLMKRSVNDFMRLFGHSTFALPSSFVHSTFVIYITYLPGLGSTPALARDRY